MIKRPRGTQDILPADVHKWQYVERVFREVCKDFGYDEIRTPLFEFTKLFKRGVGETTDIVQKEMYSVISGVDMKKYKEDQLDLDKKGLTLKPEGTAPVVRSFVENKLYADAQPTKLYYITPCSRHERPQAGRFRQFHQFGTEVFGTKQATADAEIIALAMNFCNRLGLEKLLLKVNSVGCPECRPKYHAILKEFLAGKLEHLCETCNDRYEKNPLRVLDCKVPTCQEQLVEAPVMLDHLCDDCKDHFDKLTTYLDAMDVPYEIDTRIVRGLDYYTKTAFEILSEDIGAQAAVCGGGRYDGLVKEVGGPEMPGVGFGMGIERLIMTLEANGCAFPDPNRPDVFMVVLGEEAKAPAIGLMTKLRKAGMAVDMDHLGRSAKAQFKYADKRNAKCTVVLGTNELESGKATLKNMANGEQTEIDLADYDTIIQIINE